jgi:hypothetical protein
MKRRLWWITAAAAIGISASALFARQGVIHTRDGKTIEGEIVEEKPDAVIVAIRGIKTSVPRDNIAGNIEYFDSIEARYQDKLKKLPKNATAKDHLELARWLFDVKQYDLALQEIDAARKIDPNSSEAATLEQTVMSQRRIERAKAGGDTPTPPAPGVNTPKPSDKPAPGAAAAAADKPKLLTTSDINTIRQMEWKENDPNPPRVTVPPDVRKRFVEYKALNPAEFAALSMPAQAYFILREGTPDMRKDIKITTDPASLAEYRRAVQPLVLNNCATAGCHNAQHHSAGFGLYTNNAEREDVAYTNFYLLQKYEKKMGDPPATFMMIDRTYAERSLLSQFTLPPDHADLARHPHVPGQVWKPIAASKSAPQYRTIVNWMKSLTAGEANYGISYDIPWATKDQPKADAATPPKTDATAAPKTNTPPAPKPATPAPAAPTPANPAKPLPPGQR